MITGFEALMFVTMACTLLYLQKVEQIYRFQDDERWYAVWKTMWLSCWMAMLVCILLMLFEEPDVRYGI